MLKQEKKTGCFMFFLMGVLFIFAGISFNIQSVYAADVSSDSTTESFSLYSRNPEENIEFQVDNMFPGDSLTKTYRIKVSYKKDVTIHFKAVIDSTKNNLQDVLKCRIILSGSGQLLYDGLMKDIPSDLSHVLKTDSAVTSDVVYEITAYMDTSVGNDYMNNDLKVDFVWWIEQPENLVSPDTGIESAPFPVLIGFVLLSASLILYILLRKKKKKEAQYEQ